MAQTAEFEGEQRASRNVGNRHVHEKPPSTLVAEADGWDTRMGTGFRSAPQADIRVVMETRVGAQRHMSGWDYADPCEYSYAPAPHEGYGAAAGSPRDDYPGLRPASTRDDLTNQELPRLEATVREQGMWT
jgi:hypothetical protein